MKKKNALICGIIVVSFLINAVLLAFLPERIPVHYGYLGEADRIGSKYEMLVIPIVAAVVAAALMFFANSQKRTESEKKILFIVNASTLIFMNALGIFFICNAFAYNSAESGGVMLDASKFSAIGIGALMMVFGNIMPKARKNAIFGLRTGWSSYNDVVWQKSQRFGGYCSVIFGFFMIIAAIFLSEAWLFAVIFLLMILFVIISIVASYKYYKVEKLKEE